MEVIMGTIHKKKRLTFDVSPRNHKLLKMFASHRDISMGRLLNNLIEEKLDENGLDMNEGHPLRQEMQRDLFAEAR